MRKVSYKVNPDLYADDTMFSDIHHNPYMTVFTIVVIISIFSALIGILRAEGDTEVKLYREELSILSEYTGGDVIPISTLASMDNEERNKYLKDYGKKKPLTVIGRVDEIVESEYLYVKFHLDHTSFNFSCLFPNTKEYNAIITTLKSGTKVIITGTVLSYYLGGVLHDCEFLYIEGE